MLRTIVSAGRLERTPFGRTLLVPLREQNLYSMMPLLSEKPSTQTLVARFKAEP